MCDVRDIWVTDLEHGIRLGISFSMENVLECLNDGYIFEHVWIQVLLNLVTDKSGSAELVREYDMRDMIECMNSPFPVER